MTEIYNLNLTDIKYADLATKGYDPQLEIKAGEPPQEARKLTRIVGLVKDKLPETEQEWDEFLSVWEDQG